MLMGLAEKEHLDDEEKAELTALYAHIGRLLAKTAVDADPPPPLPVVAPTPEQMAQLQAKLGNIMTSRLATRIGEVRHLGALLEL
jgi:hypothetical protein